MRPSEGFTQEVPEDLKVFLGQQGGSLMRTAEKSLSLPDARVLI